MTVIGPVQPGTRLSGIVTGVQVRPVPAHAPAPGVHTVPHVVCAAAPGALTRAVAAATTRAAMLAVKRMVDSMLLCVAVPEADGEIS